MLPVYGYFLALASMMCCAFSCMAYDEYLTRQEENEYRQIIPSGDLSPGND